jgi:uncharacterized protein YukE
VDLPGRPGGDPDALRAGARAWDHLAWEVWHLSRPVERRLGALLEGWLGPAADAYRARWEQVHRGLGELDHRLHTNADHLRVLAGLVEDAQSAYDHALAAAGIATVAGIGLTLVTGGASDALAVEADSALGATVTAMIGEFQFAIGRMMALVADLAELMGALASRFAIEFAIKGPDLAYGAVGGAATGIAFSLADGERNLRDLALSGVVGGLVVGGRLGRRGGKPEAEGEVPGARSLNADEAVRVRAEAEGFDAGRAGKLAEDPGRGNRITNGVLMRRLSDSVSNGRESCELSSGRRTPAPSSSSTTAKVRCGMSRASEA